MRLKVGAKLLTFALLNSIVLLKPSKCYCEDNTKIEIEKRKAEDSYLIDAIRITETTKIREDKDINSKALDYVPIDDILVHESYEDGWYLIHYGDIEGYIPEKYTEKTYIEVLPYSYEGLGYVLNDCPLYGDPSLTREIDEVNKYEFAEIYEYYENAYLVKAGEMVGYLNRNDVFEFEANKKVLTIDISDQEVLLYDNGLVTFTAPIVSGNYSKNSKNDHSTGLGLHQIFEKSRNRDLVGPRNSYRSYVNYMMKFNENGEGLHDANYHIDEYGKKHGWRNDWEFGGHTYMGDGSHGCANMKYKDAKKLYDLVDYDTYVLVKK